MGETLDFSVGKTDYGTRECRNTVKDQVKVIDLLNRINNSEGGTKQTPLRSAPIVAGICAPGLYRAIIAFQHKHADLTEDGHIDPKGRALAKLNELVSRSTPASIKPGPSWGGRGPAWDGSRSAAELAAVEKVYARASRYPGLWERVHTIANAWEKSSIGFKFNTKDRQGMEQILRNSPSFCSDLPPGESMHQDDFPRHCYRELGCLNSAGLHVCLVLAGRENAEGGVHDMHLDLHQTVDQKSAKGTCWYDPRATLNHYRDVMPWIIENRLWPRICDQLKKDLKTTAEIYEFLIGGQQHLTKDQYQLIAQAFCDFLGARMNEPIPVIRIFPSIPPVLIPALNKYLKECFQDWKRFYLDFL